MTTTDDFIRQLAARATPVRPLPAPWRRAAVWVGASLACVAGVCLLLWIWRGSLIPVTDRRFVIEQVAALLTGITAAIAAFATTVPGYSRKVVWLPVLPLAVWIATIGQSCVHDWSFSPHGWAIAAHWGCLVVTFVAGAVPAVAIAWMLRRGAPLTPGVTMVLGGLAAGGLAHVGARFVHPFDTGIVILVWHVGAVVALCLLAQRISRRLLIWRSA
jgi:hypothetical protein